jgi:UDPglucose 6-dehydrogenase
VFRRKGEEPRAREAESFARSQVSVRAYDPIGMEQAKQVISGTEFCDSPHYCEGADALVIVIEWEQFRALDFARLKSVMKQPVVVDLRNMYRPEEMERFAYHSIGRRVRKGGPGV